MMLASVGYFLTRCQVFPDCQDYERGIQSLFKLRPTLVLDHQFEVGASGLNRAAECHADIGDSPLRLCGLVDLRRLKTER